jgi:hypothetical protein
VIDDRRDAVAVEQSRRTKASPMFHVITFTLIAFLSGLPPVRPNTGSVRTRCTPSPPSSCGMPVMLPGVLDPGELLARHGPAGGDGDRVWAWVWAWSIA